MTDVRARPPVRKGRALFWLLLSLAPRVAAAQEDVWTGVDRVVAVGDVHGDCDQLVAVLRSAQLIDAQGSWIGGKTHLVQTGDLLDRGPDSRKAMDLLMRLEEEAPAAGGAVHALIGNHEAMNLYGDLRYVSPGEFGAFRDADSEKTRDEAYREHLKELGRSPRSGAAEEADRKKWDAEHPLGWAEHRRAFGPQGKYGRWIRGHNAVIRIDGTLFLHGGISAKYADWNLRKINDQARLELGDFSKLPGGLVEDPAGPLWYRGLAQGKEPPLEAHVRRLLLQFQVERIVVGHTYTEGAIIPRFGGQVLQIDVGLSKVYDERGRMACLVIEKGVPFALHRGHRVDLPGTGAGDLARYLRQTADFDREARSSDPEKK